MSHLASVAVRSSCQIWLVSLLSFESPVAGQLGPEISWEPREIARNGVNEIHSVAPTEQSGSSYPLAQGLHRDLLASTLLWSNPARLLSVGFCATWLRCGRDLAAMRSVNHLARLLP